MKQYQDALRMIVEQGSWQKNRTGNPSKMVPGITMRFDMDEGFPAVTTKKFAFKPAKGEICGFLDAADNAAIFRALGCGVWDKNANDPGREGHRNAWLDNPFRKGEDDLGSVYGVQWRKWPGYKVISQVDDDMVFNENFKAQRRAVELAGYRQIAKLSGYQDPESYLYFKEIDMLGDVVRSIIKKPEDRYHLFHAWNPAQLDEMALRPCHLLYQFIPTQSSRELSLCMTQRSADYFLGVPFNIASSALLLHIVARLTGYKAKWLTLTTNDSHIYESSMEQSLLQLQREPLPLPTLKIDDAMPSYHSLIAFHERMFQSSLEGYNDESLRDCAAVSAVKALGDLVPDWFTLENYQSHAAIKAEMEV